MSLHPNCTTLSRRVGCSCCFCCCRTFFASVFCARVTLVKSRTWSRRVLQWRTRRLAFCRASMSNWLTRVMSTIFCLPDICVSPPTRFNVATLAVFRRKFPVVYALVNCDFVFGHGRFCWSILEPQDGSCWTIRHFFNPRFLCLLSALLLR